MILVLLSSLVLPSTAAEIGLTYEDLLQRALLNNPTLQLSGIDLRSAEGALLAARGTFDPSLSAGVGASVGAGASADADNHV